MKIGRGMSRWAKAHLMAVDDNEERETLER